MCFWKKGNVVACNVFDGQERVKPSGTRTGGMLAGTVL